VYEQPPYISMTFGHNRRIYTESMYNTHDDKDLPVEYTRYMTASLMYAKDVHSILEIGFGGGRTAWYLHRFLPDVSVTSVELDPEVLRLAKRYFGIRDEQNFQVVNRDGRLFLSESKDKYDIILIDAYRGPFVPFHLLTKEFYQIVKDHLADGGVVAQNVEPSTMLFDSAVKTINAVFPQLDFYRADGNIVTVAYDGAERKPEDLAGVARDRDKAYSLRYSLADMLNERRRIDIASGKVIDPNAKVLTDDFAPVETLKSIEKHNRKIP
jgi:spermidine synthase